MVVVSIPQQWPSEPPSPGRNHISLVLRRALPPPQCFWSRLTLEHGEKNVANVPSRVAVSLPNHAALTVLAVDDLVAAPTAIVRVLGLVATQRAALGRAVLVHLDHGKAHLLEGTAEPLDRGLRSSPPGSCWDQSPHPNITRLGGW